MHGLTGIYHNLGAASREECVLAMLAGRWRRPQDSMLPAGERLGKMLVKDGELRGLIQVRWP
jgi:hypothetical protein